MNVLKVLFKSKPIKKVFYPQEAFLIKFQMFRYELGDEHFSKYFINFRNTKQYIVDGVYNKNIS